MTYGIRMKNYTKRIHTRCNENKNNIKSNRNNKNNKNANKFNFRNCKKQQKYHGIALKNFTRFLNTKTLFDLLTKRRTIKRTAATTVIEVTAAGATTTTTATATATTAIIVKEIKVAESEIVRREKGITVTTERATTTPTTTTTEAEGLLQPSSSSSSTAAAAAAATSLLPTLLSLTTKPSTMPTDVTTVTKYAVQSKQTATTATPTKTPPASTTPTNMQEQQSNHIDCQRHYSTPKFSDSSSVDDSNSRFSSSPSFSSFPNSLLPLESLTMPAFSSSASVETSASSYSSSSSSSSSVIISYYAATLTAASIALLHCSLSKIASKILPASTSNNNNNNNNSSLLSSSSFKTSSNKLLDEKPQKQQQQQQISDQLKFISFNSHKPKRKIVQREKELQDDGQKQDQEQKQRQQSQQQHKQQQQHKHEHKQHNQSQSQAQTLMQLQNQHEPSPSSTPSSHPQLECNQHNQRNQRSCSGLHVHHRRDCYKSFGAIAAFSLIFLMVIEEFQSANATNGLINKNEPMFISRSETFKFVSGDTIVLPCEVANTEPYIVAWKRGIAILFAGSVKVSPDPRLRLMNGFNLQIRDAVPQDAGDYICQIATMEPREITHTVEILVPPRIHHISTGGHLQVKKGSSVRIECSASGNPTPNVTWSRKNNILPNGEEKLHSHILSIENVDRHKGGVYICSANNGVGQPASSQVVLHVLYPPEINVERPIVFSGEGHEAMLVCIVHGETQPEVIWFKDTMQLDTTERHIMETRGSRHTLIIRKVHPQDFGNYSCVAENQLGKSRKTLQLSGKPNVAIFNSPTISQYKDRYNISWTVDSHTPIEEYKLSFRRMPQGHEVDNTISHSSASVSSLSSSSSSSSTHLLQIYGSNNHNQRINIGGGVGGVELHGGYGGGGGNLMHWGRNDWRDVVLPAMPLSHHYTQGMSYMIRGLDPDQHYEATVQARNRYGWSDVTHSFVFSTSSNDNEMRDLGVTFYGGSSGMPRLCSVIFAVTLSLNCLLRILENEIISAHLLF